MDREYFETVGRNIPTSYGQLQDNQEKTSVATNKWKIYIVFPDVLY